MVIYKVTNRLNGKPYVGQTKQPIEKRFLQHYHSKSPLGQAMRQCGLENFTIEIIERCYSQAQLNEREIFWIRVLNSRQPYGYNVKRGGGGFEYSRSNSSETRIERVSLVLTPDAYQAVAILAQIQGISLNNLIASILDGVIEKNATVIEKFNAALTEARADVTLEV